MALTVHVGQGCGRAHTQNGLDCDAHKSLADQVRPNIRESRAAIYCLRDGVRADDRQKHSPLIDQIGTVGRMCP